MQIPKYDNRTSHLYYENIQKYIVEHHMYHPWTLYVVHVSVENKNVRHKKQKLIKLQLNKKEKENENNKNPKNIKRAKK
jgi:hypothetical protein